MADRTAQTRLPGADEDAITPNAEQRELIHAVEGPVLVDAGAGTGKTFTVAHRYLHVLEAQDLTPQDLLLITFTTNAAEEMRERILRVGRPQVTPGQLRDAPISTFHALAKRVLERHGFHAPAHLGLEARLAPNVSLLENEVLERELFEGYLRGFREAHPEHRDRFRALRDPANLLDLVKGLAAKGIVPTREGWYRDGREQLLGDREAFLETARQANATRKGGRKQSRARSTFYSRARDKLTLPDQPTREELVSSKQIHEDALVDAFDADREALLGFVHDVYVGYLTYALDRNVLNFNFLLVLAYVLLVEDGQLRDSLAAEHVMIDEFQDTSEIQLQLALLLCQGPDLCCVGDWKQSIYGFQYASVDNILDFEHRVCTYARRLNADRDRVPPASAFEGQVRRIELVENYRSTQAILDRARQALEAPAKRGEEPDTDEREVVDLTSNARLESSRIQAYTADDEIDLVLDRIQAIVGSTDHPLVDQDATTSEHVETRAPTWEDVAVLTRTRAFALRLQARARELGVPMAFEGGVEVYRSDAAKLLLAWLRILAEGRSRRGWAVVLEQAGYTLDETEAMLDEGTYPPEMEAFRDELAELDRIGAQARAVFDRYGLRDGVTEALVTRLQQAFEATGHTPAGMARFLEANLEEATTEPIDDHPGGDVVTAQTIHAAKGLEYPIVILADLNSSRFPSTGGSVPANVRFTEPIGLRQTKVYADPSDAPAYVYDDMDDVLLRSCLSGTDHDEERRLFYVAMSRAEQHLIFTAEAGRESRFFDHVADDPIPLDPDPQPVRVDPSEGPQPVTVETPDSQAPRAVPVGDLVEEPETTGGRGRRFGQRLHAFAARYAMGRPDDPADEDQTHVARIVDELAEDAGLKPEVPCRLPVTVDGVDHVVEGKIDLLAVREDRVDVVDWKTARARQGLEAYARQVGLYAHIVSRVHEDKDVRAWVVYTPDDEAVEVDPITEDELAQLIRQARGGGW